MLRSLYGLNWAWRQLLTQQLCLALGRLALGRLLIRGTGKHISGMIV